MVKKAAIPSTSSYPKEAKVVAHELCFWPGVEYKDTFTEGNVGEGREFTLLRKEVDRK